MSKTERIHKLEQQVASLKADLQKLLILNKELIAAFPEAPKFPKSLLGYDPLFMGNGEKSQARCYELSSELFESFSKISTKQQIRTDSEDYRNLQMSVELTAAKIYFALTGRLPRSSAPILTGRLPHGNET